MANTIINRAEAEYRKLLSKISDDAKAAFDKGISQEKFAKEYLAEFSAAYGADFLAGVGEDKQMQDPTALSKLGLTFNTETQEYFSGTERIKNPTDITSRLRDMQNELSKRISDFYTSSSTQREATIQEKLKEAQRLQLGTTGAASTPLSAAKSDMTLTEYLKNRNAQLSKNATGTSPLSTLNNAQNTLLGV